MRMRPLFGPGGNSERFYAEGGKSTKDAPLWVKNFGLDAYEFEAGNGIRGSAELFSAIGRAAADAGISMSFHTPYFISLSGVEAEKRLKSIDYIRDSLNAAALMGAKTIVVHSGSAAKISREEAMYLASDTIARTLEAIPDNGVKIGLETMGKINQLGTLDEVIKLCKIDKTRLVPVVDFGHLNARDLGGVFCSADDYVRVFDKIASELDEEKAKNLHCHFSKIEWTGAGEKRHLTFEDQTYGPQFEPLMEALYKHSLTPTLISESAGTQADDALAMKKYFLGLEK